MASVATVSIRLPDGTIKQHPATTTPMEIAESIGSRLAKAVIAAEVDGRIVDAGRPLSELTQTSEPISFRLLTAKDREALDVLRHSAAHVMARAIMRRFEGVSLAFGPTTSGGFYYDFELSNKISEDDFPAIEAEIQEIVKQAEPFERFSIDRNEALQLCGDLKQTLKVEHIETGLADPG